MLATFGGGSARGFGYGLPSGGLTFEQTGMVYQGSTRELLKYNASAGIAGNNEAVKNTYFKVNGQFPAMMLDVGFALDDLSVKRLMCIHTDNASLNSMPLDYTWATVPVNTTHGYLSNHVKILMQLRNGVIVTSNNGNRMATWKMNADGTFSYLNTLSHNTLLNRIQVIINPNDGAEIGDDTHIFVSGQYGDRLDCFKITGTGSIVHQQDYTINSAGAPIWMSPMKSTDANKLRFMAFISNSNTKVLDWDKSTNGFTVVSNGSNISLNDGRVISATPSWGGYTWAGLQDENGTGTYRVAKFHQNGNLASFETSSSYVLEYNTAMLAIEDTSSGTNKNGHVYWGGYNSNNDPQYRLIAADDNANSTSFSNLEQSNSRLNSSAYTVGGAIIGERPRYAEMDAKLESSHW